MSKKIKSLAVFCFLFLLFCSLVLKPDSHSYAQERKTIELVGTNGQIDWQEGIIRATGMGLPPSNLKDKTQARIAARRAAKIDAYRNLAEVVEGVRVTSETTVKNFTVSDTKINTRVSAFIKGAREADIKDYSDGRAEVTLEAALNGEGGLSGLILPSLSGPKVSYIEVPEAERIAESKVEADDIEEKETEAEVKTKPTPKTTTKPEPGEYYTGLIVNAQDLGLQPALSPKILTEENEEIYGISYADPQYRTNIGLVGYHSDLETAQKKDRVARSPYVIDGLKVTGANKTDVVIRTADALAFQKIKGSETIVERCRVIVILK